MVLKVRKVITILEEYCLWYIFSGKQLEMPQILPKILRKAAAKSVILVCKNQKKSHKILEGLTLPCSDHNNYGFTVMFEVKTQTQHFIMLLPQKLWFYCDI